MEEPNMPLPDVDDEDDDEPMADCALGGDDDESVSPPTFRKSTEDASMRNDAAVASDDG